MTALGVRDVTRYQPWRHGPGGMIAEIGHFALILAFLMALSQAVTAFWGAARRDARLIAATRAGALLQLLFAVLTFAGLVAGGR